MALIQKPANLFTGKVTNTTYHEDTKSLSVLLKVLTENGKVIKPKTVSFSLTEEHPLAQKLYDREISELGVEANGFSPEPIKPGSDIYALVGLRKRTLAEVLGGISVSGEEVTDENELKRSSGLATRALDWMRSKVDAAMKA